MSPVVIKVDFQYSYAVSKWLKELPILESLSPVHPLMLILEVIEMIQNIASISLLLLFITLLVANCFKTLLQAGQIASK